jgi:hypothetical protein
MESDSFDTGEFDVNPNITINNVSFILEILLNTDGFSRNFGSDIVHIFIHVVIGMRCLHLNVFNGYL